MLLDRHIEKNSSIPYYHQLKVILEDYLEHEHPGPDALFPTEEWLAATFAISRPTVRQAINELVVEGRLIRIKGKGTFVSKPKIRQNFTMRIESYESEMLQQGMIPKTDVLRLTVRKADATIAERLQIRTGDPVIELHRLRYANGEPFVYVETYLPMARCPDLLNVDFVTCSLYASLAEKYGFDVAWIERSLETALPTREEADMLRVDNSTPLLYFESVACLSDKTPIEYSRAKYRGDRSRFSIQVAR